MFRRSAQVCLAMVLASCASVACEVFGQDGGKPVAAAAADLTFESTTLSDSVFDWTANDTYVSADETPDGKVRLAELVETAKRLIEERKETLRERRIPAERRDSLLARFNNAEQQIVRAQALILASSKEMAQLNQRLGILNGQMRQNAEQRVAVLQAQVRSQQPVVESNLADQMRWSPDITALNATLQPLDDRLRQNWKQLEETRKQWLKIRDPISKYSIGELEVLRKVLDDWLVIDGLWPEAHLWAALCAYELGDYDEAHDYLEKADDIRRNTLYQAAEWPEVLAMRFLVGRSSSIHRQGTSKNIQKADNLNKKKPTPLVHFLIAISYTDRDDNHARAMKYYNDALEQNPKFVCARVALARLQTISKHPKVASEAESGLKTLQKTWQQTGERSWRLASYLAEAHYKMGSRDKASEYWKIVLSSQAPDEAKAAATQRLRESVNIAKPDMRRMWTKQAGGKLEATLVGTFVKLKKQNGDEVPVLVKQLSLDDQVYLRTKIASAQPRSELRNWKSKVGTTISASLEGIFAQLSTQAGTQHDIDVALLTADDRKYLEANLK